MPTDRLQPTDDIVDQLRREARAGEAFLLEAADEIERLRRERARIVAWLRSKATRTEGIFDRAFAIFAEEIADGIEAGEHAE